MKYSNITAKYISTSYGQQTNSSKQLTVDSMQDCIARNHPLRRKISGPSVKETKDFGLCAASLCYCSEASEIRGHMPPMPWYIYPRDHRCSAKEGWADGSPVAFGLLASCGSKQTPA